MASLSLSRSRTNTLARLGLNLALSPIALLLLGEVPASAGMPNAESIEIAHGHGGSMDDKPHDGHGDGHGTLEVPADMPAPTLAIAIEPDTVSGWNLEITTENFELTGEMVGAMNMNGEGHAHVYANGVKIARVYGNWYHIPELPTGEVELRVTLNSNQHEELTLNGEQIEATAIVTVAP